MAGETSYAVQRTESLMLLITLRDGSSEVKSAAVYLALQHFSRQGGSEESQHAIDVIYFRALCRQLITATNLALSEIEVHEIAKTLGVDGSFENGDRCSVAFNGISYIYIMNVYQGRTAVMVVTKL